MRPTLALLLACTLLLPAASGALEQTIPLGEGYNFISLHVVPESLPTSAQLLETGKALSVFRFDRTSQSFVYQLKLDGGQLFGNSFSLQPGEGYVLKCGADPGSIVATGAEYAGNPLADLVNGFNFVGLYAQRGTMARALLSANPFVDSIFRWIQGEQAFGFVLRLPDGSLFGEDFALEAGKGYFLKYEFVQYTLTVSANPLDAGKVLVDPGPVQSSNAIEQLYPRGTFVRLDAFPNDSSRHVFDRWSGPDAGQIDMNGQIRMNGNRAIVAEFRELDPNELPLGKKVQKELPPLGENGELRFYFFTDAAGDYRVRLRSTRNIQQLVFSIWDGTDTNRVTEYDPTSYDNSWSGSESNSGWYLGTLSDKMKFQQSPEYIHADIKNLKAKTKYWLRVKNSREQSPAATQNEMVEASVEHYPARLEFDAVVTTDPNEYSIYTDSAGNRYGFVPLTPGVTHFGRVSPYFQKQQFVTSAYTMHYPESTRCYFKFTPDRDGSWSLTLSDWEYKDYTPIRTPSVTSRIKLPNPFGASPYDPAVYPDFEEVAVQDDLVPSGRQVIHLHGLKAGLTYYWRMEAQGLDSSSAFRAKVDFLNAPDNVGFRIAPKSVDISSVTRSGDSVEIAGKNGFTRQIYNESYYILTGAEQGKMYNVDIIMNTQSSEDLAALERIRFDCEFYSEPIQASTGSGQARSAWIHQGFGRFLFEAPAQTTYMRISAGNRIDSNLTNVSYRMNIVPAESLSYWNTNWGLGSTTDNPHGMSVGASAEIIPVGGGKDLWIQFIAPPTNGVNRIIRVSFLHGNPSLPNGFTCYPEKVDTHVDISSPATSTSTVSVVSGKSAYDPNASPAESIIIYSDNPDVSYATGFDSFFEFGYRSDEQFGRIKMKIVGGGGMFVKIRVDALQ